MIAVVCWAICFLIIIGLKALPDWFGSPAIAVIVSVIATIFWTGLCILHAQYKRIAIPRWMELFVDVPLVTRVWRAFVRPMRYDSVFGKTLVILIMFIMVVSAILEHEISFAIALAVSCIVGVFLVERYFQMIERQMTT